MALKPLNSIAGFSTGDLAVTIIQANGDVSTINFTANGVSNLGPNSNVIITGGSSGQFLQTNGSGNLSWATVLTSGISNGTSNTDIPTANGNVNTSVGGVANVLVITSTGANITGTLNSSGNATVANLAGGNLVSANFVSGTLTTAAQPNITSVGTLTDLNVNGNAVVGGNLTVNGNLIYVNVEELSIEDPIINLNTGPNGAAPSSNSGKDVGSALNYYDTQARIAFMGWDTSNAEFAFGSQTSIAGEIVTFSTLGNVRAQTFKGNLEATTIAGNLTTAAQPNITSVGTLTTLSVSGNANVGNIGGANTISANYLVSNSGCVSINGALLAFNNATGEAGIFSSLATDINFGLAANITAGSTTGTTTVRGNLIVNNNVYANSGTVQGSLLAGTLTTASQPNITSLGTLTSLSVTGNISANNATANTVTTNSTISKRSNTAVTTDTVIDSFSKTAYRTAKYIVKSSSDIGYESLEVLLIHNNINSYITVYAVINDGGGNTISLSTAINSGNVELRATGLGANTVVNLIGTYVPD